MGISLNEIRESRFASMSMAELEDFVTSNQGNNLMNHQVIDEVLMFVDDQFIEKYFVKSANPWIRIGAAKSKNLPPRFLKVFAKDQYKLVRSSVAHNPNISFELQVKLSKDESSDVREAVAESTNSVNLLIIMKEDEEFCVRTAVARNKCATENILHKLAHDKNEFVRNEVANSLNTDFETLKVLAHDKSVNVRAVVAKTINTEILTILSNDVNLYVLEIVCRNNRTPSNCLESIYGKYAKASKRIVSAIASNTNTPSEILEKIYEQFNIFSDDIEEFVVDEEILSKIASNPNTPKKVVAELAKSKDGNIRANCAYCVYKDILLELAEDSNEMVFQTLACNKIAMHDEEIIAKVLKSPYRKRVIENILLLPKYVDIDEILFTKLLCKEMNQ